MSSSVHLCGRWQHREYFYTCRKERHCESKVFCPRTKHNDPARLEPEKLIPESNIKLEITILSSLTLRLTTTN